MEKFEKIFKEKLEKHNAKVRAGAWAGVSAGVAGKAATGSGLFSGGALTYIATVATTALVATGGTFWYLSSEKEQPEPKVETVTPIGAEEETTPPSIVDIINPEDIKENYVITESEDKTPHKVEVKKVKKNQLYTKPVLSPTAGFCPLKVQFSHETTPGATIHWRFGDGTESFVNSLAHTYVDPGVYEVTLTAKDKKGNTVTEKRIIEVKASSSVKETSKIITPNGDGVNDAFMVEAENVKAFNLSVFNRFGEFIFETNNPEEAWTGLDKKGKPYPEGTYLYTLKATGLDGKEYSFNGQIQLK